MSLTEPEFAALGDIWHTKLVLWKFALDEGRFSHPQVKDVGGGGFRQGLEDSEIKAVGDPPSGRLRCL